MLRGPAGRWSRARIAPDHHCRRSLRYRSNGL